MDYSYDGIDGVSNPTGDDGVQRIVEIKHTKNSVVLDRRTYTWDGVGNKKSRMVPSVGRRWDYTYDAADRLTDSVLTQIATGYPIFWQDYQLDKLGNRETLTASPDGMFGVQSGTYELDSNQPVPSDYQMNQYTATPFDYRKYDANGNLVEVLGKGAQWGALHSGGGRATSGDFSLEGSIGTVFSPPSSEEGGKQVVAGFPQNWNSRSLKYDYRNQLVEFTDESGRISKYRYDPFGRRIEKHVHIGLPDEKTTRYIHKGWQVIEEQNGSGGVEATYYYGNYIDEPLAMERGGIMYYYHQDDLYNVVALTDSSGNVVERYEYNDYGQWIDPGATGGANWDPTSDTAIGNLKLFTGREYEVESSYYFYRMRYMDPETGRFVTRDPIGIWGDGGNFGNGYGYAANSPTTMSDPTGLWGSTIHRMKTSAWSREFMSTRAADDIADADEAVDGWHGLGPLGPMPFFGTQSYHFNTSLNGPDTRAALFAKHFALAIMECAVNDDGPAAAKELGTGLHPLQDYVAHGDFGMGMPPNQNRFFHNEFGKQGAAIVDNDVYDAQRGPQGRPAGPALKWGWHYSWTRGKVWAATANFVVGNQRYNKTRKDTKMAVLGFLATAKVSGGCQCKKYFGI